MRKGINHFLKELGILLFFAFPWFYAKILGYYYPVLMHRYAVIVFFIITFSILLCLYISFWVDFYIILVNSIDPNYMKLSPNTLLSYKNGMRSKKRLASSLQKLGY